MSTKFSFFSIHKSSTFYYKNNSEIINKNRNESNSLMAFLRRSCTTQPHRGKNTTPFAEYVIHEHTATPAIHEYTRMYVCVSVCLIRARSVSVSLCLCLSHACIYVYMQYIENPNQARELSSAGFVHRTENNTQKIKHTQHTSISKNPE